MERARAEAHLAAEAHPAQAEARLSCADVDARRACGDTPSPLARALATRGLARLERSSGVAARPERLRRSSEITRALRGGTRARRRLVQIAARPNGLGHSRVALSVGKRIGLAVARNRVKRRLRAMLRDGTPIAGYDIVVTAREGAASAPFDELRGDLERCLRGIGLSPSEDA